MNTGAWHHHHSFIQSVICICFIIIVYFINLYAAEDCGDNDVDDDAAVNKSLK